MLRPGPRELATNTSSSTAIGLIDIRTASHIRTTRIQSRSRKLNQVQTQFWLRNRVCRASRIFSPPCRKLLEHPNNARPAKKAKPTKDIRTLSQAIQHHQRLIGTTNAQTQGYPRPKNNSSSSSSSDNNNSNSNSNSRSSPRQSQ